MAGMVAGTVLAAAAMRWCPRQPGSRLPQLGGRAAGVLHLRPASGVSRRVARLSLHPAFGGAVRGALLPPLQHRQLPAVCLAGIPI